MIVFDLARVAPEKAVLRPALPEPSSLATVDEVMAVRAMLPRVTAGDPLQSYKWELTIRIRKLRMKDAGRLPESLIRSLIQKAGNKCSECGHDMRFWVSRRWPTVDHIKALANGGSNDAVNLRVICNRCNSRKSDRAN